MRQPTKPETTPSATRGEREPGRSFNDHDVALGDWMLERSPPTTPPNEENVHGRARQAAHQAVVDRWDVAERAKVIGVLRKAEEFMSTSNPPANSAADVRRALELASGRMGLTFQEYRALADSDPELLALEHSVIEDARRRWGTSSASPLAAGAPSAVEEPEALEPASLFARIFVPVDYTMESHSAVAVALELRRRFRSSVCLYHAVESTGSDDWLAGIGSPSVGGDWVAEAQERLRRFLANIAPEDAEGVEVRSKVGLPLETVSQEAHAWGATLVVSTASLRAGFIRSPAEKLVRKLELPVLVIPK